MGILQDGWHRGSIKLASSGIKLNGEFRSQMGTRATNHSMRLLSPPHPQFPAAAHPSTPQQYMFWPLWNKPLRTDTTRVGERQI